FVVGQCLGVPLGGGNVVPKEVQDLVVRDPAILEIATDAYRELACWTGIDFVPESLGPNEMALEGFTIHHYSLTPITSALSPGFHSAAPPVLWCKRSNTIRSPNR